MNKQVQVSVCKQSQASACEQDWGSTSDQGRGSMCEQDHGSVCEQGRGLVYDWSWISLKCLILNLHFSLLFDKAVMWPYSHITSKSGS